jgi:predicted Rossmann fold flavoprotein
MSGPAILQISNYWQQNSPVEIDLFPGQDAGDIIAEQRGTNKTVENILGNYVPDRLAKALAARLGSRKRIKEMNDREVSAIGGELNHLPVIFSRTEGYDRAEVTIGGVSTDELSSKTMEAKKVPGLYFIGEVVDVTGWLGGYNFQWAWSSAHAAAMSF